MSKLNRSVIFMNEKKNLFIYVNSEEKESISEQEIKHELITENSSPSLTFKRSRELSSLMSIDSYNNLSQNKEGSLNSPTTPTIIIKYNTSIAQTDIILVESTQINTINYLLVLSHNKSSNSYFMSISNPITLEVLFYKERLRKIQCTKVKGSLLLTQAKGVITSFIKSV